MLTLLRTKVNKDISTEPRSDKSKPTPKQVSTNSNPERSERRKRVVSASASARIVAFSSPTKTSFRRHERSCWRGRQCRAFRGRRARALPSLSTAGAFHPWPSRPSWSRTTQRRPRRPSTTPLSFSGQRASLRSTWKSSSFRLMLIRSHNKV